MAAALTTQKWPMPDAQEKRVSSPLLARRTMNAALEAASIAIHGPTVGRERRSIKQALSRGAQDAPIVSHRPGARGGQAA
ncbi:MAG: hypothetical protein AMXMBFR23_15780 [Chloroflexota bacterium]